LGRKDKLFRVKQEDRKLIPWKLNYQYKI